VNEHIKTGFAILVGAGWLFNLIAPVFVHSYDSSLAANAPLMLVLGALFATRNKTSGEEEK
jgi:hypothetical protein